MLIHKDIKTGEEREKKPRGVKKKKKERPSQDTRSMSMDMKLQVFLGHVTGI